MCRALPGLVLGVSILAFFPLTLCNAQPNSSHNSLQDLQSIEEGGDLDSDLDIEEKKDLYIPPNHLEEGELSGKVVHFRSKSDVTFPKLSDFTDPEIEKKARAQVELFVENRMSERSKTESVEAPSSLPRLSRCSKSASRLERYESSGITNPLDQIDLLFFDPTNPADKAAAEIWFSTTVPYNSDKADGASMMAKLLGVDCLPTRVKKVERGIEIRTGEVAWMPDDKEQREDLREIGTQIHKVRKSLARTAKSSR